MRSQIHNATDVPVGLFMPTPEGNQTVLKVGPSQVNTKCTDTNETIMMKFEGSSGIGIRVATAQRLCVASGVIFAGALLLAGQPPIAAHWQVTYGQSLAQYQASEQSLTNEGFRPISLDVDGVGDASRYAVIWRKDGFTNWLSDIELPFTEFTNRIAILATKGYRVLCLDSHGSYPAERYAAVWVQDERAAHSTVDVRDPGWSMVKQRVPGELYTPIWVDVNPSSGAWYAATYTKTSCARFAYWRGGTESQILDLVQYLSGWGWPAVVRSFNGVFTAIWVDRTTLDGEDFRLELNQSIIELGHTVRQNMDDGYDPISLTQSGAGTSFCSVWRLALEAVPPNRISNVARTPSGQARLEVQNAVPRDLRRFYELLPLQSSTNLSDWAPMATVIKTNANPAPAVWTDSIDVDVSRRFYLAPSNRFISPVPPTTGPHAIGEFSELLTDPSRTNIALKTNMQFMVTCWYPAAGTGGRLPMPLLPGALAWNTFTPVPGSRMEKFVSHSSLAVPLAANVARYPVVLYSPSLNSHRRENQSLVQELASHGFVVVGMDHRETVASVRPDGSVVYGQPPEMTEAGFKERERERLDDARLVIAAAEDWQTSHPLLSGRLDLDRVGAFGFSFGGSTAADVAEAEPRCKASVDIDGSIDNDSIVAAGSSKPFLLLCSGFSGYEMEDTPMLFLKRAKAPAYFIQVAGTLHQSFSEAGLLQDLESFNRFNGSAPDYYASVDGVQAQALARSVLVSFFKRHLMAEEDGVLDTVLTNSPAVTTAVSLHGGPVLTKAVKSTTITVGQPLTLSVTATNQEPLVYQWFSNGAVIPGATNAILTVATASMGTAGQYTVRVTGQNGTTTCSCPVTVLPLRFASQPINVKASYGGSASFVPAVQGPGPFSYQWAHNGQDIPGATNASLTLTNVQAAAMGSYTVRASNGYGTICSTNAQLYLRPFVTEYPQNQILRVGEDLNLTVRAVGSLPMRYQWRRDNVSQCRLTRNDLSLSFTVPGVQLTNAGAYSLTITNLAGTATSPSATASVLVVQPPTDQEGASGSTVTFSAPVAKGTAVMPGLQWQFGGTSIEGANTETLVLTNIQPANAGVYTLVVTNNIDRSTSLSAVLKVSDR